MSRFEKVRQQESGLKIREEQPGDKVSFLQPGRPMAWDLSHQEVTECFRASRMCKTSGSTDSTDLASLGEEEDDGSVNLKKHFSWWEPERNENERRDFRLVRRRSVTDTEPGSALLCKKIPRRA